MRCTDGVYGQVCLRGCRHAWTAEVTMFRAMRLVGFAVADSCPTTAASKETVIYWGQNTAAATEAADLSTYCKGPKKVDIIVLAFLNQYGKGQVRPSATTIGQYCTINPSGVPGGCDQLASQIKTCQANKVKIFVSLGGASGDYTLASQDEAEQIGHTCGRPTASQRRPPRSPVPLAMRSLMAGISTSREPTALRIIST